ncbi:MAG: AbrB/MazE/SpoVT family DNA-binding domain-containing protein [Candidatus Riflebacteria bacterium]|nr:AbrB/MazE/SpoVT family DNA-binding domain-containing protein [Candidatus Riflebacteria bacterium]
MKGIAITVDNKGRLSIPIKSRKKLGINPGDILFFRENDSILQYAKLEEDPFEILAKHALQEYQNGNTISIEEYAQENDIPLKTKKSRV